jgi:hypothetical protein
MTDVLGSDVAQNGQQNGRERMSLGTAAARNLATTTKSAPQMQEITSRWLLRLLPWVQASGGAFRVNRRLSYSVGTGRVSFAPNGSRVRVIPPSLSELPLLRGFDDPAALTALAEAFTQRDIEPGDLIVEEGQPADALIIIAHGKVSKLGTGKFGHAAELGVMADGDAFGDPTGTGGTWDFSAKAKTDGTVMTLTRQALADLMARSESLRTYIEHLLAAPTLPQNEHGEAEIDMASGHVGEPELPGTFVDYETTPREYELSVSQTVLQVHTRVADLYNNPMNQLEEQLRLTVEALRERQEHEMVNNPEFGLLHNADFKQRIQTQNGPPTPDDFDELLDTVWKDPAFFLAHPRAIAAFGRECSRRGVYPQSVPAGGSTVPAWRGVPIFPCNKIPISGAHTTSVMLMRTGMEKQGVIGLHQTGIPDEYQPSLNVRFMGINEKAVLSYLVSAYYSAAVMVPDALGILEHVEIGHAHS